MKILKKFYAIILMSCIVLISGLFFILPACTPKWVNGITEITDVIWYSNNPQIEILILRENVSCGFGYIYNNDDKIDIYFSWGFTHFNFYLATDYSVYKTISPGSNYPAISGQYEAISDTEATLIVQNDSILNGKYKNYKFIIKSREVNRDELDIKYYTNVQWTATTPTLTFHILPEERRRGVGKIEYDNITHDILFYWEDDSKFSVYELQGDIQSESPILTGMYTSSNLKATLTIEDDLIFNHEFKTIELIAKGLNDP